MNMNEFIAVKLIYCQYILNYYYHYNIKHLAKTKFSYLLKIFSYLKFNFKLFEIHTLLLL